MFEVKVHNAYLTVVNSEDIARLHLNSSDKLHLGDYDKVAEGLYISASLSRGDLYRKYSPYDYDQIDFGVPQGQYDPDNRCVWSYEFNRHGSPLYDRDILKSIAGIVWFKLNQGDVNYHAL